jgi:serine/threonine protein kinase
MFAGSSPEPGQHLGPYRITRRLGIGATSEVLLAVSHGPYGFERTVVIKRLLARCEVDPALHRMLASEAVAYARLTHPAIVRLYDFFAPDGKVALVLEYVDGPSLARLGVLLKAKREALGDPAALYIASRVFAALAAAHAARDPHSGEFAPVIHRDVSPGNILIPWDGFVKLGDFGMAKVSGVSGDSRAGTLKGTYGYMAPEQVVGERVSPRTDVYAGCLLLRELLLSRPAFAQGKMAELEYLKSMADPQLTPLEKIRGGLSRGLTDAMQRGLARDPEERTLTAAEMVRVLRHETDMDRAHAALVMKLARVRPPEERATTPSRGVPAPPSTTLRLNRIDLPPSSLEVPDDETPPVGSSDMPNAMTVSSAPARNAPRTWATWGAMAGLTGDARRRVAVTAAAAMVTLGVFGAGAVATRHAKGPVRSGASRVAMPPATGASDATRAVKQAPLAVTSASVPRVLPRAATPPIASQATPAAAALAPAGPPLSTTGEIVTPASARSHRVFLDGQYAAPSSGVTLRVRCGRHAIRIGSAGTLQSIDVPCGGTVTVFAR